MSSIFFQLRKVGYNYNQITLKLLILINTDEWSSPNVIGQPPPPSFQFTLTKIDDREAALFGGRNGTAIYSDLLIVKLLDSQSVVRPITSLVLLIVLEHRHFFTLVR